MSDYGNYSTPRDGTTDRGEYWRKRLDREQAERKDTVNEPKSADVLIDPEETRRRYFTPSQKTDHEQAERGSLILNRLVPAPDHGAGFRRDPETGFVYYSSEWLSDAREDNNGSENR